MVRYNQNHSLNMVWKQVWKGFEQKSMNYLFSFLSLFPTLYHIRSAFWTLHRLSPLSGVRWSAGWKTAQMWLRSPCTPNLKKIGKIHVIDFRILHFQLLVIMKKVTHETHVGAGNKVRNSMYLDMGLKSVNM